MNFDDVIAKIDNINTPEFKRAISIYEEVVRDQYYSYSKKKRNNIFL